MCGIIHYNVEDKVTSDGWQAKGETIICMGWGLMKTCSTRVRRKERCHEKQKLGQKAKNSMKKI